MIKKLAKFSVSVMLFACLNGSVVYAGSSAKVTDEDKKAAEEVSSAQENKDEKNEKAEVDTKEEGAKKEELADENKKSEEEGVTNVKSEEKSEETESEEKKQEESTENADNSDDNSSEEGANSDNKATDNELYKQELTRSSKKTIKDFEKFIKELSESKNESSEVSEVEYNRGKTNELLIQLSGEDKEKIHAVDDTIVVVEGSEYQVPVRYYQFGEQQSKDLMIFVHGGGWTHGNLNTHDYLCRKLAKILEIDVVSVDYRLSPEHPYPVPLDDVLSVYKNYVSDAKYDRLLICGDSAGANLCAALCARIYESELKAPYAQILLYPPLSNNFENGSYKAFGTCVALSKEAIMKFFTNYAGKDCTDESLKSNDKIFPLLRDDITIYPEKTIIISAGYDSMLDEQIEFEKKLKDGDKNVLQVIDNGAVHGYMSYGRYYDDLVTENCEKIKAYIYGDSK